MDYDKLIEAVKKSIFFTTVNMQAEKKIIKNSLLEKIKTKNIMFPERLKHYMTAHSILTLEDLLNTEPKKILLCRCLGIKTIDDSRKIILDYLNRIKKIIEITVSADDKNIYNSNGQIITIVRYFPLLQGTFKTSEFNYQFINSEVDSIHVPKRIQIYISGKCSLKSINDLVSVDYISLRKERNIGYKTIKKLQIDIINLLNLERISSVSDWKNFRRTG